MERGPLWEREPFWEREKRTWPNREMSRFVDAAGIRWHVQQAGSGHALFLLHGTGASTHSFRDLLPALARDFTVIAADLPGHAFTGSVRTAGYSLQGMSDSLSVLLDALKVTPHCCIGHSAGAAILCRMALDGRISPRRIVSINGALLPLAGAAGVLFSPIAKLLAASALVPRLIAWRAGDKAAVERVIAGTGSRLDAVGLDLYARLVRDPDHIAGALAMMGNWDLRSFERDLPRLKIPLTLIVGQNDRAVPPQQALRIQSLLESASLHSLPGLGHLAHEEAPALVAQLISAAS
jgi:magnesium chelatase accessory protein